MKRSIICITGVTGIIGKRVLKNFKDKNFLIRVLTRKPNVQIDGADEVYCGDIAKPKTLNEFLCGVNVMFHCAGEIHIEDKMNSINVHGTKNIIDVLVNETQLDYFCYISSAGVVGPSSNSIINEESPCNPQNTYEISKFDAEQIVLSSNLKCKVALLRPINVVDETKFGVLEIARNNSLRSKFRLFLKGGEFAHLVHAESVALAAIYLMNSDFEGKEIFFVSNDLDKKNNFAQISSIYNKYRHNKNTYPIHLPAIFMNSIRSVIHGNRGRTNIVYSPEKLTKMGFQNPLNVEEAIKMICLDLLK